MTYVQPAGTVAALVQQIDVQKWGPVDDLHNDAAYTIVTLLVALLGEAKTALELHRCNVGTDRIAAYMDRPTPLVEAMIKSNGKLVAV